MSVILDLAIGTNTDDAIRIYGTTGYYSNAGSGNTVGWASSAYAQYSAGMRFTGVTIAQGSTIDTATLIITCKTSGSVTTVNSRVRAEDVDNAATFGNQADWDARFPSGVTTATADWDAIAAWTANTEYSSPEIKTVIQEIVNRASWASGNAMVIFWDDYDDRSTHATNAIRVGYSYDNDSTKPVKIHIEYTAAGGGGSEIKTINGLAKASAKTVNGLAIASVKTWGGVA